MPSRGTLGILVIVILVAVAPWFNIPRDQADSAGMLSHLHTYFVGVDLLYDDEYRQLGMSPLFAFVTPEGVVSNHWPSGATWLQAPGYWLGLVAARVLAAFGVGKAPPEGAMGVVPLLAIRTWALLVVGLGSLGLWRWATAAAGRAAGSVVTVGFALGTPLLYYAAESPLRPHAFAALVVLGFVVIAWSRRGSPLPRIAALATLCGLATAMRPQLAPLFVLVLREVWTAAPDRRARALVIALAAFAPWPLLHARLQLWMYGSDLGDYSQPVSHHVLAFLGSSHHGVLLWCPIVAWGLIALARSVVRREPGAWLVAALVVHQVWLDSGMREIEPFTVLGTRTWSGGLAFGPRKLLDVLPLLLPSTLSWAVALRSRPWAARAIASMAMLCVVPTVLLLGSAFIDPTATTGVVLDARGFVDALARPLDPHAWVAAGQARRLPLLVPCTVALVVGLPTLLLLRRASTALLRLGSEPRHAVVAATGFGLAMLAHAWVSVLQVRTDAILVDDPNRMQRARDDMHPRHVAIVARIPFHHRELRDKLGEWAAPPR